MSSDIARLATRVAVLERQLARTTRTARMAYSSIEDGAIEVYDDSGTLRASVGVQLDGTVGIVAVNGSPPPATSAPQVEALLGGLAVTWNGRWQDDANTPLDFAGVQVHASSIGADFTPGVTTLVTTLTGNSGGTVTLGVEGYDPVWIRLMAVNTSLVTGPATDAVQGTPRQAVSDDLIPGIIGETQLAADAVSRAKLQIGAVGHSELAVGTGNLMPDPSFEGAFTDQLLAANPAWTLTEGNGTARALHVVGPASLYVTELPASPGDRFYLAIDHRADGWAGDSVRLFLRWRDATGAVLGYGTLAAIPTTGWARAAGQVQAPAGTAAAAVFLETHQATAGSADFDNAEIRTVIGAGMVLAESIGTLELAAEAVAAGKVAADTITGREVKALSLTSNELATNSVTAGKIAAGAVQTPHISVGAVTPEQIAVGQGTNLIPDPSFEGAASANTVVAGGAPWAFAPGNRTGVGIIVDCTADTATYFALPLVTAPILAAAQLWMGVDILASDDFTGQAAKILARWESANGTVLGYGVVETTAPEAGRWQRITGQVAAPQGTAQVVVCLEASAATSGWAVFDNAEAHTIFGRVVAGERAEVGPQGLRLYDETGEEAVSLVTGAPQYLTLRSDGAAVATIDTDGNAMFGDVAVAGDLTVDGEPVGALLDTAPRGIVARAHPGSTVSSTGTEMGYYELPFTVKEARLYRVRFRATANIDGSTDGEIRLYLRDGGTAKPTITSTLRETVILPPAATGRYQQVELEHVTSGTTLGTGLHRLLLSFDTSGGAAGQTLDLGLTTTGRTNVFYVEDVGPEQPLTGAYNTGGGTADEPVQQYTKTYTASWSGSYANRSGYNAYHGAKCFQGYYSSNNGIQAALIGFPATLATDLAGATIEKVLIYLYADHWYSASGGKAVIKAHSHTSRPAKFSSDSEAKTISWRRNQGQWVDITAVFDSTKWRGIALDPNSTASAYYGSFRGASQTYAPKLRVIYTK